jgi:hypothetical protein
MKQHEAVIQTLEKLGGQATLVELYTEVMKVKGCKWATRTPFASIRRIVQTRPEIFKVRPGLWALHSYKAKLGLTEARGKLAEVNEQSHSYYQGLLVVIGNLRDLATFVPNQDKNRLFVQTPLGDLRTLQAIPRFSHEPLIKRAETIDVLWFNERLMPHSLYEVEHSTDIQNSLLKFYNLRDFSARLVIVAHESRQNEFEHKRRYGALAEVKDRVKFLSYDSLVKMYEYEVLKSKQTFVV